MMGARRCRKTRRRLPRHNARRRGEERFPRVALTNMAGAAYCSAFAYLRALISRERFPHRACTMSSESTIPSPRDFFLNAAPYQQFDLNSENFADALRIQFFEG